MVKRIADGKCQYCSDSAPFIDKQGEPYLEAHHVVRLADGGKDAIENVVAICPNCHRKIHVLNDEADTIFLEKIANDNKKQLECTFSNIKDNRRIYNQIVFKKH